MEEDGIYRLCDMNGKDENTYRILARKPEGERPFGRIWQVVG
jgi:hypothetical protein